MRRGMQPYILAALRHADSGGAFPAVAKTRTLLLCLIFNTPVRLAWSILLRLPI